MSLVTRCTACGTLFKVVADQLKISEGWVRCGQCSHVFDAQANLVSSAQVLASAATPSHTPASAASSPPRSTNAPLPSPARIADAASALPSAAPTASMPLEAWPKKRDESARAAGDSTDVASNPANNATNSIALGAHSMPGSMGFLSKNPSNNISEAVTEREPTPQSTPQSTLPSGADIEPISLSGPSAFNSDQPSSAQPESRQFQPGRLRDSEEIDSDSGPSSTVWAQSSVPFTAHAHDEHSTSRSAEPTTFTPSTYNDTSDFHGTGETRDLGVSLDSGMSEPASDGLHTQPEPQPVPTPSFIAQARAAARWRRPWVRALLSLVALALLALLGLQIALHDKDRIAAAWPQSKPYLTQLCARMGCSVQAPKRLEAIVIDSSSFNRIQKNNPALEAREQSYRLGLTLKNTSAHPVAMPSVELSLQDAQDQPIVRRVLSPADLGLAADRLISGQDAAGSLTLQVSTAQLAGNRINGYRVIAFYP